MTEEYCGKIKKVGEFAEAETFNASDVLFAEQNGRARKMPGAVLQEFVKNAISGHVLRAEEAAMAANLSAVGAENVRQAIEKMEVSASTLETGAAATVNVAMKEGGFVLTFGLPKGDKGNAFTFSDFTVEQLESLRGDKGDRGDKGERGDSGVTAPIGGFFTLTVDEDGNLWVLAETENVPDFEYDAETGNLYIVQKEE